MDFNPRFMGQPGGFSPAGATPSDFEEENDNVPPFEIVRHPDAPPQLPFAIRNNITGGFVTGGSPLFPRVFATPAEAHAHVQNLVQTPTGLPNRLGPTGGPAAAPGVSSAVNFNPTSAGNPSSDFRLASAKTLKPQVPVAGKPAASTQPPSTAQQIAQMRQTLHNLRTDPNHPGQALDPNSLSGPDRARHSAQYDAATGQLQSFVRKRLAPLEGTYPGGGNYQNCAKGVQEFLGALGVAQKAIPDTLRARSMTYDLENSKYWQQIDVSQIEPGDVVSAVSSSANTGRHVGVYVGPAFKGDKHVVFQADTSPGYGRRAHYAGFELNATGTKVFRYIGPPR